MCFARDLAFDLQKSFRPAWQQNQRERGREKRRTGARTAGKVKPIKKKYISVCLHAFTALTKENAGLLTTLSSTTSAGERGGGVTRPQHPLPPRHTYHPLSLPPPPLGQREIIQQRNSLPHRTTQCLISVRPSRKPPSPFPNRTSYPAWRTDVPNNTSKGHNEKHRRVQLLSPSSLSLSLSPHISQNRHRGRRQHKDTQEMHITVSWAGGEEVVQVDEGCRSVAALLRTVAAAVPELDAEKVCLEIGGCAADDEAVCGLCEGCVVTVSVTPAVRAAATLREEGHEVDCDSFRTAAEDGNLRLCRLYLEAGLVFEAGCDSPLTSACREGHLELCKVLIDGGLPVDVQDRWGDTLLHDAAKVRRAVQTSDRQWLSSERWELCGTHPSSRGGLCKSRGCV